jgi:hypothetical protein
VFVDMSDIRRATLWRYKNCHILTTLVEFPLISLSPHNL